jgi:hypothetical protein
MSNSNSEGIGFFGLLTLLLIALKLTGTIQISWWWVLSPIWISILVAIIAIAVVAGYLVIFIRLHR